MPPTLYVSVNGKSTVRMRKEIQLHRELRRLVSDLDWQRQFEGAHEG